MVKGRYLLPVFCCVFLASCAPLGFFAAGTAAGIGGYKYYQGALNVIYQAPYIKTWNAALKVLEEMEFTIESKRLDYVLMPRSSIIFWAKLIKKSLC